MGYRDYKLALSTSQAISGSNANSEDHIDTEQTIPGWEKGMPCAVIINCEADVAGTTGFTFTVCHKATEPTINDANLVAVTVPKADLTAGKQIVIPLPYGVPLLQMVRLYYTRIGADETGTFSAYFTPLLPPI